MTWCRLNILLSLFRSIPLRFTKDSSNGLTGKNDLRDIKNMSLSLWHYGFRRKKKGMLLSSAISLRSSVIDLRSFAILEAYVISHFLLICDRNVSQLIHSMTGRKWCDMMSWSHNVRMTRIYSNGKINFFSQSWLAIEHSSACPDCLYYRDSQNLHIDKHKKSNSWEKGYEKC